MKNKNVLGKSVNGSKFKSLMAGVLLLASSGLLNNLQAQDVVTDKELIKKEQEANKALDPLFEDVVEYLYGAGLQEHINQEIARQRIDTVNLDPKFLKAKVLKILQQSEAKEKEKVNSIAQVKQAIKDTVETLLILDYAKVADIYIKHIESTKQNIVIQKKELAGTDPYNRVALPRKVKIDALTNLFGEKGLFGKKGRLGNTKAGKEFAETETEIVEQILNASLQTLITKFEENRKMANMDEQRAIYTATVSASKESFEKFKVKIDALVDEAVDEIFKEPAKQ